MNANPWFSGAGLKPGAQVNLICFGSAGSGGSQFLPWNRLAPPELRVLGVQLPGREFRHREPLCLELEPLLRSLADAVAQTEAPFALFGHSFGALLAFETARRLRAQGRRQPLHLFVAGRAAPQLPLAYPRVDHLPEAEFIEIVRRFGGTDPQILGDSEPLKAFLPAIRADLRINADYHYRPAPPLDLPVTALRGSHDPVCSQAELLAWRDTTRARAATLEWDGAHFFYKQHLTRLIATFATALEVRAADPAAALEPMQEAGAL